MVAEFEHCAKLSILPLSLFHEQASVLQALPCLP
jgi:hypothetical protein